MPVRAKLSPALFVVAFVGAVVSALLGIAAGYIGGPLDLGISRTVDFMYALPALLIAIVAIGVTSGGFWVAVAVLSVLNVLGDIRIVRSAALDERALPYIEALRTLGFTRRRIMFVHVFPNISPILITDFALDFAFALVALSGLAFLGLGSQPSTPEWGRMLSENQIVLFSNPESVLAPGVAVVLLASSVAIIGDWFYDLYGKRGTR